MIAQRCRFYFRQVTILFAVLSSLATIGSLSVSSEENKTGLDLEVEGGAFTAANKIAFSPDGKTLVAGGGWLRMWDVETGTWTRSMGGQTQKTRVVSFSPDGNWLAINRGGPEDNASGIQLYRAPFLEEDEKKLPTFTGLDSFVNNISFSGDGRSIAAATEDSGDSNIGVWDIPTRKLLRKTKFNQDYYSFQETIFLQDNQLLLGADIEIVNLWNTATNKYIKRYSPYSESERNILTAEDIEFQVIAVSPDEKTLAAGDAQGVIRLWDVPTARFKAVIKNRAIAIQALAFSPDGTVLASGDNHEEVVLWNIASAEPQRISSVRSRSYGNDYGVVSLAFSPNGKLLADGSKSGRLTLWNLAEITKPTIARLVMSHIPAVKAVEYSKDEQTLFVGTEDNSVKCYNTLTGALRFNLTGHKDVITMLAQDKSGTRLWSGSYDGTVKTWNVKEARLLRSTPAFAPVSAMDVSSDGKVLAVGHEDGFVRLWNTQNLKVLRSFRSGKSSIPAVAFSPDTRQIAIALDSYIVLRDAQNGKVLRRFPSASNSTVRMVFSNDGKFLYSANDNDSYMWDVKSGKLLKTASEFIGVSSLELSNDGKTLFVGSTENVTTVRNAQTLKLLKTFDDEESDTTSLTISPLSSRVAIGRKFGLVDIYNVQKAKKLVEFRMLAPANEYSSSNDWLVTDTEGAYFDSSASLLTSSNTILHARQGNVVLPFSEKLLALRKPKLIQQLLADSSKR